MKKKTFCVAIGALAGVPLTLWAAGLTGSDITVTTWGLFGTYNYVGYSNSSVAVGTSNTNYDADNSLLVGSNLIAYDDNSLVVGKWNEDTGGQELFVAAIGTDYSNKKNAFEVTAEGRVRIPEVQGELSLGDYGN